jgi:transposase
MEVLHRRCVGIDIAKASAKVCLRVQGAGRRRTEKVTSDWSSM